MDELRRQRVVLSVKLLDVLTLELLWLGEDFEVFGVQVLSFALWLNFICLAAVRVLGFQVSAIVSW